MDQDYGSSDRRRSIASSSLYSTASSSSSEFVTPSAVTPESDDDVEGRVVPKIEELGELSLDDVEDAKLSLAAGSILTTPPRKRGRPRKHPIVEQKKPTHARSKTGCATCRKRKKKCDEGKPSCLNCEKINLVCDGYEPKVQWRGGQTRRMSLRSTIPGELPMLIEGIEGSTDQLFFKHFICQVSKVLSLTDRSNPFLELVLPLAFAHVGLMHSLLSLSGSCLIAKDVKESHSDWEERQEHHSSRAMNFLQQDILAASKARAEGNALATVSDPSIAQTLVLCLQTTCTGNLLGEYRFHVSALKEMLTQQARQQSFSNEPFRQFILEFLIYHDYVSSITSLTNPIDQRSIDLMTSFRLPGFIIQPQAGTLLGVMDGLFILISRTRNLRDVIRRARAQQRGGANWWSDEIMHEAFAIDAELRTWHCVHTPGTPRFTTSLLYRQCAWIYLHRTIQLSRPSATFRQAVAEGLEYLRDLPWGEDSASNDGSTQSILLMPLFLLGCAAFEEAQRPEIRTAFERLQAWSSSGNVRYAREIVEQIWGMMDEGRESETWDWEGIIAGRGWDFLVC